MLIYLIMLSICCLCGIFFEIMKKSKNSWILMVVAFLVLFLVSGFRYGVGQDFFATYVETFRKISEGYADVRIDVGFYMLIKIILLFHGNSQWMFILTGLMINGFVCKSIYDQSKNKMLSLFIYICGTFFFFSLNGVRQAITISMFYFSLKYIKDCDFKKYLVCNLVGLLFHQSAIIFIPLYFILNKKFSFKLKVCGLIGILLFNAFLSTYLISFLASTKYAMYVNNGAYKPLDSLNVSSVINIVLFLLYEIGRRKKEEGYATIYSNIHYIGIIITMFFTTIPLAIRMFVSFRYIEYLSVPALLENSNMKFKQVIRIGIMCLYFAYFIHGVYIMNGNNVLPYHSIFG